MSLDLSARLDWPLREYYDPARTAVLKQLAAALEAARLTNADLVARLEMEIAARTGAPHCVAVASATSGLILATEALTEGREGDVIIPTFAFNATILAPLWSGRRAICVPVDPGHFNLCARSLEPVLYDRRVAAILAIGVAGNPSGLAAVAAQARAANIPFIVDAAPCLGAVGALGDAAVISMSPRKLLPAGEGGLILTDSEELALRLQRMRQYGSTNGFHCIEKGLNARLSELHAAVALGCIAHLDRVLAHRVAYAESLRTELGKIPGVSVQLVERGIAPAWNDVVVRVPALRRDALVRALRSLGSEAVPFYDPPVHRHPAFRGHCIVELDGRDEQQNALFREAVGLPVLSAFGAAHRDAITATFRNVLN
jgi:dTDP-4-amino-4,6-dideoxygalactose transaminase